MKRNRSTAEYTRGIILSLSVTVAAKESKTQFYWICRILLGNWLEENYSDTFPLMLTKKPTLAVEEKKEKHLEEGETKKGNST